MECIFCKIARKEIPTDLIYEDERVVAFNDINPQAPVHVLIIPKNHLTSLLDITQSNADIISHIVLVAKKLAEDMKLNEKGFRIVNNCGKEGGQTVGHLHFHLLGGRSMTWPPG